MLLIKNARIINPESKTETIGHIAIENGTVKSVGAEMPDNGGFESVIDAAGMAVAPGLIDAHVHFREPGFTYKEDIASGAKAAAKGGFTTVICMANTKPAVDCEEILREVLAAAQKTEITVLSVAAVSKGLKGAELTDMARLKAIGAVAFSDDGIPLTDAGFLRRAMLKVKEIDAVISLHEEDPSLILNAGINAGKAAAALGISGAPAVSESSMVARDAMLALDTGARTHFQHLSCERSVQAVRFAKSFGARITAEITPQHFSITESEVVEKGATAKLNPPLRSEADRLSLIEGLRDGTIDIIATDHAPHSADEKSKPLTEAPSGMTGLETALSLGITKLVREGYLTLPELIEKMTLAPARLFGLKSGRIAVGERADIVIFDDSESYTVRDFASKSSNSPFIGEQLYGKVKYTICGGKIVYHDK